MASSLPLLGVATLDKGQPLPASRALIKGRLEALSAIYVVAVLIITCAGKSRAMADTGPAEPAAPLDRDLQSIPASVGRGLASPEISRYGCRTANWGIEALRINFS